MSAERYPKKSEKLSFEEAVIYDIRSLRDYTIKLNKRFAQATMFSAAWLLLLTMYVMYIAKA